MPDAAHRSALPYLPALDGLRGIAVAAVLLFHGGHLLGGYLGVDLFFVLSGYLITSLLLVERERAGRIRLGHFWARRARRLLPALAGLLLGVAAYAALFAAPDELARIRGDAWATLLYVPNWYAVFAERDYWALFRTPSPLQHAWSLGIEEQFYLAWPLALVGIARLFGAATPRAVWALSLGLAAASAAGAWALYEPSDVSRAYYGTDTRAAAILLGAALAAWRADRGPARTRTGRALLEGAGAAGAALLAWAWWSLDGQAPALYRGGLLACGVAGTAVIAAVAHPRAGALARLLSFEPLRRLGVISYGVYLWHWPVYLVLTAERTALAGAALFALRGVATLGIAIASHRLVERPVRRGALTPRQWAWVGPGVAAATVAALLAATPGARTPAPPAPPMAAVAPGAPPPTGEGARVLLVGDSVAINVFHGLAPRAAEHGLALVLGVEIGCERDEPGPDCPASWPEQAATLRPDLVLVVESGVRSLWPLRVGSRVVDLGTPAWDRAWIARRAQALEDLLAAGAKRVAITSLPCFAPSIWRQSPRLAPEHTARANANLTALAARHPDRVEVIDLAGYLCPGHRHRASLGPVRQLRVDGVHYTPEAAALVGRWLAPRIAALAR